MPAKRKRKSRVPTLTGHPSQSSIDVPARVKKGLKGAQDNKCWLCSQKAHKTRRPLQICHIFPQAKSQRFNLVSHHKLGRTQLDNIHDPANLIALCEICHNAFDDKEWSFLPKDMAAWVQDVEAEPERGFIQEINSRRNIEYRRWRFTDDPESEASKDEHYVSAFTNEPIKVWPGEVGVVILGNTAITMAPTVEVDILEAIRLYIKLIRIWTEYNSPCSKQECILCNPKEDNGSDKDTDQGSRHYEGGEDDDNKGGDDSWYNEGSEDDNDNEGEKGRRKRNIPPRRPRSPLKISPKSHRYQLRHSSNRSKVSTVWDITRKKSKSKYYSTIPYDKSVPYSHRVGYTYANTTSNELMAIRQKLPYIKHADGRITIIKS